MNVDGSIGSLIQGVSQQPARERLPGQCTLQENCSSDPVDGLKRRAPLQWVDNLITSGSPYRFTEYDGGDIGKFVIGYTAGDIQVYDLEGNAFDMVLTGDTSYIPSTELEFIGVDNKIFMADPNVTVAMLGTTKAYVNDGGIAFLLGGQYGRTYSLIMTWKNAVGAESTATVTNLTPDGASASDIEDISTKVIAANLATAFAADLVLPLLFDLVRADDVIYIKKKPAADVVSYTLTVEDGDGGSNFFSVNGQVGDVGGLPRYAPQGYVMTVEGNKGTGADDFYLEFVIPVDDNGVATAMGAGFGRPGKWIECVAPGLPYQFDPTTMPHILEKTDTNEFTYLNGTWEDRRVGDDKTCPIPTFVGKTIRDLSAFQGRLVILSDVNCVMSRTDKPTDYFNQSATTLADDDPIDVASALGTFILKEAVPHNRDLVIFSDAAQFIVFGRNSLTPRNTSLVLTTKFEADLRAAPVSAGKNVIFPFKYGKFTGLQEFFTEGSADANDARPITQHVLQYIVGVPIQLISTTNFSKLLVRTDNDLKTFYVYEYIWLDSQKVQSSWSKWTLPRDIEHAFFVDNLLYVVGKDGNDYNLYTLDLDDTPDNGVSYRVLLDEKIFFLNVDDTFDVPYSIDDIDNYIAVQGEDCPNPGMASPILSLVGDTVTLKYPVGDGTIIFGRKFLSRYIPTPPQVKDRQNVKIGSGKLTVKHYIVHFEQTGYMKAIITDKYGYEATVSYSGRVIGDPNNVVGEPAVSDGSFMIPFKKEPDKANVEIQSDSHLPLQMLEIEWEGQWRKKGQRIGG